jgi:hypothetical protein
LGQLSRQSVAQDYPQTGQDLTKFPSEVLPAEHRWRAHSVGYGAWYFNSSGGGRFDLDTPNGTCYFADDVETAVRERLGQRVVVVQQITETLANEMQVSVVLPAAGVPFANIVDPAAARHGVTRELGVMSDYGVSQQWAEAFHTTGFGGVRYSSRFTTSPGPNSWAMFGPEGPDLNGKTVPALTMSGPEACLISGIKVMPSVAILKSSLRVIPPPA